jgi:hypothetical protein
MKKLKVALRNYTNASKNEPLHLQTGGFLHGKRKPGFDHIREMSRPQRMSKQFFFCLVPNFVFLPACSQSLSGYFIMVSNMFLLIDFDINCVANTH